MLYDQQKARSKKSLCFDIFSFITTYTMSTSYKLLSQQHKRNDAQST